MAGRRLLVETSFRTRIALADGVTVVDEIDLGLGRQNNKQLVPALSALMAKRGWTPASLDGIAASLGPGSYTGLRVGLTLAKSMAYALGRRLIAIPTFDAIAMDFAGEIVAAIGDALNGTVYYREFARGRPVTELGIRPLADVLGQFHGMLVAAGGGNWSTAAIDPQRFRQHDVPSFASFAALAEASEALDRVAMMGLEPLYLRGSSAEERASAIAANSRTEVQQRTTEG